MVRVPEKFRKEFEEKGETFFAIAELLYTHPDRQYTQDELAEKMGRSKTTISNHTSELVEEEWLNQQDNQTTYTWNSDIYNPASTEGISAVRRFYADLWTLLKKHSDTLPGTLAIMGFFFILTAIVVFAFYIGFSIGILQGSGIPPVIYSAIAVGSFLTGVIVTLYSPIQAVLNRFAWRIIPNRFL